MFQDLRKKESARRLILINSTLEDPQKKEIARVGFGGLLLVQCWSVPEKLSSWLIKRFDVTRSELVIPYRGRRLMTTLSTGSWGSQWLESTSIMQRTALLTHMKNFTKFSTMKMTKKRQHSPKLKIGYWVRERRGVTPYGCGIGLSLPSAHSCALLQTQVCVCGHSMRSQI